MSRGFGSPAFEPVEEGRDREITLGPMMLGVLGLALVALCSLCFIGGYAVGHSGQAQTAAPPSPSGPTAAQLLREGSKPAAAESSVPAAPAVQPASASTDAGTATQSAAPASATPATYPASGGSPAPAVVHAALPAQTAPAQTSAQSAPVQAALQQAGTWMVQIAAVSHPEDADVLMSALRQRGYAVSMRRDPVDSLIHVQVGPFATHNDAVVMRQRLLNDGYNAVIQP